MKSPPAIVIVQYSANIDGSAMSALMLADGLRRTGWRTHVAFGFYGPSVEDFKVYGHLTHVVTHNNWLRRNHLLRFFKDVYSEYRASAAMYRLVDQVKPNVVYVNTAVSLAGAIAARRAGLPCIWHLRELYADVGGEMQCPAFLRHWVSSVFPCLADRLVVNSKAVAQNMLGTRRQRQVEVVYNAVNDKFFEITDKKEEARVCLKIPLSALLIGVPGTLRPVKGHRFFLNAVGLLLRQNPDIHIAISGGGQPDHVCRMHELANNLEGAERIHFTGWMEDMRKFYRACDICCVTSVSETFGRVVIEAFASGVPVIATKVGGMVEIIEEGETGFLVPYGNEQALQQRIGELLSNPILRQKMGEAAYKKAVSSYKETKYQKKLLKIVNSVLTYNNQ